jgi:WD40 repeat protein
MSDVFISYSRKDNDFVHFLHRKLVERGRDIWVDWEDIPSSADWWKEVCTGIESADTFLFIISPDSVRSKICHDEIEHAVANNKRFLPILHRDLVEESDKAAMHQAISSHNWIFFRESDGFDSAFEKLTNALDTDLSHVREHTRLLVRAIEWDQQNRNNSLLLNGTEIQKAETWLTEGIGKKPEPTDLHTQFILASRTAASRRQRALLIGVSIALVVSLVLAAVSLSLFGLAETRRVEAENNRALAVTAQAVAEIRGDQARSLALAANARNLISEDNPNLGLALALESFRAYQPPLADIQQTLAQTIYGPGARYRLQSQSKSILGVAFNPRGETGLSLSADTTLVEWDLRTGEGIHRFDLNGEYANTIAYSPDGKHVLLGMFDGSLRLWDLESGRQIKRFDGHTATVMGAVFSPNGEQILSAGLDSTIRLWDIASGEQLQLIESPSVILDIDFSPDGKRAVTGSADKTMSGKDVVEDQDRSVSVWDLETGERLNRFTPNSGFVRAVAFSPNGSSVASGTWNSSEGGKIQLWNLKTQTVENVFYGHTDIISALTYSPDSKLLFSVSWDSSLRVWDLTTGVEKQRFQGINDRVLNVAVSPDGEYVLTGTGNVGNSAPDPSADNSREPSVWLWDLENRATEHVLRGHQDWVWTGAISPNGRYAASGSGTLNPPSLDTSVRLWDLETGQEIWHRSDHTQTVNSVAFSPDSKTIASGSWDMSVRLWDVETGQSRIGYNGHTDRVLAVTFSPDGKVVLSASRDKTIQKWDVETGKEICRFVGHGSAVNSVAFSPDGKFVLSGSDDRTIRLWDAETCQEIPRFNPNQGHSDRVNTVAFSPDGTKALSTSWDTSARLWDIETGELITQFVGHSRAVFGAAFSPDGKTALTSSADLTLRLWDVATGQEIRRLTGHTNWILSVAFSQDGRFALSAAEDDTLRLWRLETSLQGLIDWAKTVRYVPELTCAEREAYNIEPFCTPAGIVPTVTPAPTPVP